MNKQAPKSAPQSCSGPRSGPSPQIWGWATPVVPPSNPDFGPGTSRLRPATPATPDGKRSTRDKNGQKRGHPRPDHVQGASNRSNTFCRGPDVQRTPSRPLKPLSRASDCVLCFFGGCVQIQMGVVPYPEPDAARASGCVAGGMIGRTRLPRATPHRPLI